MVFHYFFTFLYRIIAAYYHLKWLQEVILVISVRAMAQ